MTMKRNIHIITPASHFWQKKGGSRVMKQKKFSARLAIAASAFVLAAGLALSSTSAVAATTGSPAPTVSFAFTHQTVDSGTHPGLTYSGWNLPAGSEIWLQLAYGTPTQWYYVERLNGTAGTATLPSLPPGLFEFRVVVEQGITVVATSPTQYLSVVQSSGSGCAICELLGGSLAAILTWLLGLL